MSYLNADTPLLKCLVRSEFLYNLESHHGETEPVIVFGVSALSALVMTWRGWSRR